MYLHTDSIFRDTIREDFDINITNISINNISQRRKRGDQMELIYKWLEKKLFKKKHEVMKLRFQKIKIEQELERAKKNKEYMAEAAAGDVVVKDLDELRECE